MDVSKLEIPQRDSVLPTTRIGRGLFGMPPLLLLCCRTNLGYLPTIICHVAPTAGPQKRRQNRALPESLLTPNHLGSEYNRSIQGFRKSLAQDFNFRIGNASQQSIYHIFSSFHYSSVRKPNTHPIRFPVELGVLSQG